MSVNSPFPKRLKEARLRAGLSQKELGIAAGIDPFVASPRVNQYERGKHMPDYSVVSSLAKALGLPAPYFYTEDDDLAELIERFARLRIADRRKVLKSLHALAEED